MACAVMEECIIHCVKQTESAFQKEYPFEHNFMVQSVLRYANKKVTGVHDARAS